MSTPDVQEYWELHYGARDRIWTERVNARLAEIVEPLRPGRALDLGCGEGADALWLADRGWRVVAVDVSQTALQRAAADALYRGLERRIDFQRHDLNESFPEGTFDLVAAHYLHSPLRLDRERVLRRAAHAVAAGGFLLIVDHGAAPPWASKVGHDHVFPSVDDVVASLKLDDREWKRARVESVARSAVGPEGQNGTVIDNVIFMRRAGWPVARAGTRG
jgi:SAM-dependent methyltransferase